MKSLTDHVKLVEGKRRSLEDLVDTLNEDIAELKARESSGFLLQDKNGHEDQVLHKWILIWCRYSITHRSVINKFFS